MLVGVNFWLYSNVKVRRCNNLYKMKIELFLFFLPLFPIIYLQCEGDCDTKLNGERAGERERERERREREKREREGKVLRERKKKKKKKKECFQCLLNLLIELNLMLESHHFVKLSSQGAVGQANEAQ